MTDHDDSRRGPNPAFLKTRMFGSHGLSDINGDDNASTEIHQSQRPTAIHHTPHVDADNVDHLNDRPPVAKLPSFSDTAPGPGFLKTARQGLPPVAPAPPTVPTTPSTHSPTPSSAPPSARVPTWPAPAPPAAPSISASMPMPLVSRHHPQAHRHRRPGRKKSQHRRVWKAVYPSPRFPPSEPLHKLIPPRPQVLKSLPKPVEDRLVNALAVLFIGTVVAFLAGWSLVVTSNLDVHKFISAKLLGSSSATPASSQR